MSVNDRPAMSPDYANLTPDCMMDAVESLGLYSDGRFIALNSYENRVYQVGIEDSVAVIAKFYRPNRWTDAQILEEHELSYELAADDLPVVTPIQFNGQSLHCHRGFRFSLFERRGGRAADMDDFDNLQQLGRFLGRMHVVGIGKDFQYRPAIDRQSFGVESADFISAKFIPDGLRDSYRSLTDDLLTLIDMRFAEIEDVRFIRCHGDCHAGNLLWREGLPNFVDFDDARMAPAVQDLWMLLSGSREEQERQLSEVIEAYNHFNSFDVKQLNLKYLKYFF